MLREPCITAPLIYALSGNLLEKIHIDKTHIDKTQRRAYLYLILTGESAAGAAAEGGKNV
jgi:hypothetical protein